MQGKPVIAVLSAGVILAALLTGPPSFDATDGAEFAVCGAGLQIAHPPGYPLFLMLLRLFSMATSPLYGHLRLINCLVAGLVLPVGYAAFRSRGIPGIPAGAGAVLLATSAPVMSQLNSLEVYPLAILLLLSAVALGGTRLGPYASGMAVFAGHPSAVLCVPLMTGGKWWRKLWPMVLIPMTLMLYVPLRAGSASLAHYGHPVTLEGLIGYLGMYSGRLSAPSLHRLWEALSFIGPFPGAVMAAAAFFGGRPVLRGDLPVILALLFLASYELPDPAGQLWVLLVPLILRSAKGLERIMEASGRWRLAVLLPVSAAAAIGIGAASRNSDDIAMRWTTDVLSGLPAGAVYRPVAHDAYYAAYATTVLGMRGDVVLSDPLGNYFELMIPPPAPTCVGSRPVHVSRAWDRADDFLLAGLIFQPVSEPVPEPDWEGMEIFRFCGSSPDPMAMDLVAEAWARRMLQTAEPQLRDSFYRNAAGFSATELTGRRIEDLRDL